MKRKPLPTHLLILYLKRFWKFPITLQRFLQVQNRRFLLVVLHEMRKLIDDIGEEPEPPLVPTIILNEPTTEGFLKSAATSHAGRAIITDEAGAFLGGHSMTSEKKQHTLTTLSKLWDGSAVVMSRVGRDTPPVRDKRLTMHLMGQSVIINPLLSDPLAQGQGLSLIHI